MISLITILYELTALFILGGYIPQIIKLWKHQGACPSISASMWLVWTLTAFISVLYALLVLSDKPLILVSSANLTGCLTIYCLIMWKSYKVKQTKYPY